MNWLNFLRGFVRPFIVYTGWIVFLIAICCVIRNYMDTDMAKTFAVGFMGAITTIIGVYIGGRMVKK